MKKLHLIILLLVGSGSVALAQESYFYLTWHGNMPMTNKTWLDTNSGRGAKLGYRKFIGTERRFSAGLDFNWAYYQEYKPTETFQQQSGAITTDYFNNISTLGITASGQYYFPLGNGEHFFPYVGLGLGAARNEYTVAYNIYNEGERNFGFLARPEAGMLIRIGNRRKMGIMAAVNYDYSTAKSDNYNYSSFSAIGIQLGVMFLQW